VPHLTVCSVTAALGSVITFAFGMWEESLTLLLVAMAIDYITGVTAAIKRKKGLNSLAGTWGLARKGIMLLVILLAHRIDLLLGFESNIAMSGAIYFYLANEFISILENIGRIGVPLPVWLRELIEVLNKKT
jgi:toxin secretion/phage lysis holin